MTDIAKLVLAADTRQLKAATGDLRGVSTQAQHTGREADKLNAGMSRLAKVGMAALITAAGGAVAGLIAMTRSAINTADEMTKAAQSIGIGVEELSRLRYAADLSGISFQGLQSSIGILNRNMSGLSEAGGTATKAFEQMGIATRNADGSLKSSTAILKEMADVFQTMPDGAQKSAIAMAVLGRSGAQMIPLLNGGSEALAHLTDEADRFGIVIDEQTGRRAEAFNDNLTRLQGTLGALAMKIAADMLPHLVSFTDALVRNADKIMVVANALGNLIRFTANAATGFGILVGRVSDLTRSFSGWAPWLDATAERVERIKRIAIGAIAPLGSLLGILSRFGGAANTRDAVGLGAAGSMKSLSAVVSESGTAFQMTKVAANDLFDTVNTGSGSGGGGGGKTAVAKIGDDARDAERALSSLRSAFISVQNQLDPALASQRRRAEQQGIITDAARAGIGTQQERLRALGLTLQVTEGIQEIDMNIVELAAKSKTQTQLIADNFAQMSQRVVSSLQGLSNSIRSGDFLGILGGVLNTVVQLGSIGAFGKGFAGRVNSAPAIPAFANGTNFAPGGMALVGERGPELVNLPRGSQVIPNHNLGGSQRIEIVPSQYFDVVVDGRIANSAPLIAQAGASVAQAQMAQSARRRVRG